MINTLRWAIFNFSVKFFIRFSHAQIHHSKTALQVNTYVISFYETMMVYAHVLNELIKKDQGFNNGTLVTLSMWNRTYAGNFKNLNTKKEINLRSSINFQRNFLMNSDDSFGVRIEALIHSNF